MDTSDTPVPSTSSVEDTAFEPKPKYNEVFPALISSHVSDGPAPAAQSAHVTPWGAGPKMNLRLKSSTTTQVIIYLLIEIFLV